MGTLSLVARFPLGMFYGHRTDKSVDFSPSPARLHSALLSAAAQGVLSHNGSPAPESLAALRWLEKHPPEQLFQPETLLSGDSSSRFMYREVSSINPKRRTEQRRVSDGVAVAEGFGYRWNTIPDTIATTITALAADIPYLGEGHSISVVEAADFTPNLELDSTATAFTPGGIPREVPQAGRTDELLDAFSATRGKKPPTAAADKVAKNESPRPAPVSRRNLTTVLYKRRTEETPVLSPWTAGYFFSLDAPVPPEHRVELCTAMHRALIAQIGADASPVITGKYLDETVPRPANRLAIQYLPPSLASLFGLDSAALMLFVPQDVSAVDLEQITQARHLTRLWGRRIGKIKISYTGISRRGDDFWPVPQPGVKRFWRPLTPVIPETRRITIDGSDWTLADSGLLSLAFVWRDDLALSETGPRRYLELRDQVAERGATVHTPVLETRRATNYVHRAPRNIPIQPYTALFELGDLAGDRTAVMVGQSRHLGGGLLAPFDVHVSEIDETPEPHHRPPEEGAVL